MTQQQANTAMWPAIGAVFLLGLMSSVCSLAQSATSAAPVPWSAPASVSVVAEAKTFENGPTKLSGTLYLARGRKPQSAIVVTHAAAAPSRDDLQTSDYALLADDALAAVRMLKADPRIDSRRVGIWG